MNQYEVMYIIDPAVEEAARAEIINHFSELVTKNGGEVDRVDEWGKRRLAYAINYKKEGYYVLMYVKGPSEMPKELERNFRISDDILRCMVIRYEGALPAKREQLKPYQPREFVADAPAADADEDAPVDVEADVDAADEAPESEAE